MLLSTADSTQQALNTTTEVIRRFDNTFLNVRSLAVLAVSVIIALIIGRFVAFVLRKVVSLISRSADKIEDLNTVNRLRRYETILVLSIAVIRTFLVIFAVYYWWIFIHPGHQPSALIGASALLLVIISGAFSPVLRDVAGGAFMMAEHWYGVGDHISIEPYPHMQGVVERVTLRSTRIRGLNGEIMWIGNQNIAGVRLAPRGIRSMALELFVSDAAAGEKLIAATNRRLPVGPLLVVKPLEIVSVEQVGESLWHITTVGETAPQREWLLEKSAVDLIKELDANSKNPVIAHGPLARYADPEADRRFARSIKNARKRPITRKRSSLSKSVRRKRTGSKTAAKESA